MCDDLRNNPVNNCTSIYLKALLLLELPFDDTLALEGLKHHAAVIEKVSLISQRLFIIH